MDSGHQEYRRQTKDGLVKGTWSSSFKEFPTPYLEFSLQVLENKTLKWKLDEYQGSNENKKIWESNQKGKLMNAQEFEIKDFSTIIWSSKPLDKKRLIVRFNPTFFKEADPEKLERAQIAVNDAVVLDNRGRVWSEGSGGSGDIIKFLSKYGSLYVSFISFKGSSEIGIAREGIIETRHADKLVIRVRSEKPILGPGLAAKVYGVLISRSELTTGTTAGISTMSSASAERDLLKKQSGLMANSSTMPDVLGPATRRNQKPNSILRI